MRRNAWHFAQEGSRTTLARHMPARLDVAVTRGLPAMRAGRLAHQVRQDLWRAFRGVRGFSPVIHVDADAGLLMVTAGGRLDPSCLPHDMARARIAALLDCPANRARWAAWAQERAA